VVVAGDTLLFHGNAVRQTLAPISGTHDFIGTPYATIRAQTIKLSPGDFFIIASDGIVSLAYTDPERNLEKALAARMDGDLHRFVERTLTAANGYYRETIHDRSFGRFGGNDNVSLLLVYPEFFRAHADTESSILGGYIEDRPQE
jgi:serine/threonine protein phosphatase PrpC